MAVSLSIAVQAAAQDGPKESPAAKVSQSIGADTEITISYHRPGVKGREIWGTGLAAYDEPWRAGANNTTVIAFSSDVVLNGKSAVEYIKKSTPDLILLDMVLGDGIDGLDVYTKIKEMKPDIKTVLVSGYAANERVEKAIKLGVVEFVKKPYTMQLISKVVYNVLNN